jgi:RNA polymerase sigma factor (TIGR02999 family)
MLPPIASRWAGAYTEDAMSDVTDFLTASEGGQSQAAQQLLPLVYDELRRLAAEKLSHEKPGQTLDPTALVHEAYLRLVGKAGERRQGTGDSGQHWNSRGHFFAAAAEAMRRILVEHARSKNQVKRGGQWQRIELEEMESAAAGRSDELLALDEVLTRLETHDAQSASLVKLRYFAGLSMPEAAQSLGIPLRTAERNWTYARTWLHRELG